MKRRSPILAAMCALALLVAPANAQITGEVLFSKDGAEPMIPASMTKMMTAYLVFDMVKRGELKMTDRLTVSADAWRRGGFPSGTSTMGLVPKDTPTIEELLHGVMIMSGNDACIVLAEGISGSEEAFARRMTDLAHEKGLKSANFLNSTGLEAVGHVISAEDLAHLAKMTVDDFPEYYKWYNLPSYSWREYTQPNRNPLLGIEGADGVKTGHLEASGYGLTGSAERDGVRRTIVINGMESMAARASEGERMLRLAFQSFELKTIAPENVSLPEQTVWLGQQGQVPVSLAEPMLIAGHKAAFENAKTEIVLDKALEAPVKKGDRVGRLVVTLDGRAPVESPIIAEADVNKIGFFGKAIAGLSALISGNGS